jgi:hypothetical protein
MTLRNIVFDIETILKQNIDDYKISFNQLLYWTLVYANRLKQQHIEKTDSGLFISVFENVEVKKSGNKKYIELPEYIFDMNKDSGINYISYASDDTDCLPPYNMITFTRTTHSAVQVLYYTDEEAPATDNPYFIVEKDRIILLGIECIDIPFLEIGIFSSFNIDDYFDGLKTLDENFAFPEQLLSILQRQVLDIARFGLMIPREIKNDGNNIIDEQVPKQKILPVSEENQQQQL